MDNTVMKIEEYMNSFISPKDRLDELIKKYSLDKKGESYIFRSVKRGNNGERNTKLYCTNCCEYFSINKYKRNCPKCEAPKYNLRSIHINEYKSKEHLLNIFFIVEILDENKFNIIRIDESIDLSNFSEKQVEHKMFVRGYIEYNYASDVVFAYIQKKNGGYRRTKKLTDLFSPKGRNYTKYYVIGVESLEECSSFFLKTGYKEISELINTEEYRREDMERLVKYIDYNKNQGKNQVELLAKAGYTTLVKKRYLYGEYECSEILNRKGTKINNIIKLPKKASQIVKDLGEKDILLLEEMHETGNGLQPDFVRYLLEWEMARRNEGSFLSQDMLTGTRGMIRLGFSNSEIHSYLIKADLHQAIPPYETLGIWYDYVNMAQMMDVPYKRFPSSLKKEHDLMARDYQYQKDEIIEKEFQKRKEQLKSLEYEGENFVILAPKGTNDIVREGKVLRHCVASYIEKVATKETTVLFVRKKEVPEEPFYTIEVRNGKVVQIEGSPHNRRPSNEVMNFVKEWEKIKLSKKRKMTA